VCMLMMCRRGIALAHLNGPIYAVGGLDDSACFNIVERYDAESDCWTTVQSMNSARGGVAVTAYRVCVVLFPLSYIHLSSLTGLSVSVASMTAHFLLGSRTKLLGLKQHHLH